MPTTPPRPILVTPWAQPSPLAYKRQRLSSGSLLAPVHRKHSSEAPSDFSGSWEGFLGDSPCAPRNLTTHARQPATQPSLDSLRNCFPLDTDGDLSMFSQGASMLNGIEGWDTDWHECSHMQDIASLPSVLSSGPESYTTPLPTSTLAPTSAIYPAVSAVSNAALLSHSIERLEAQSQDLRIQLMEQEQGNKQTSDTYARHVIAYETWWDADQASAVASGLSKIAIPAFPIIVSKVAMFLKYETTREKKKRGAVGESVAGSSVGKEHIKQIISALEHKRLHHQHLYRDIPDAQISLRGDVRIRVFESAAKKNEGERIRKSQALKAAGTSSDTYTTDELTRCSRHLLGVTGWPNSDETCPCEFGDSRCVREGD
ncbi:hypothetical protein PLICRDRAFT_173275 [Plicaturopsis crispa FD-325 SS-3]|nr:hypothetical protein PLICRDRAFT_173275 [Plicaturopsis crispa FD-325 SS-3]